MTAFTLIAALLTLLVVVWVAWPLLRGSAGTQPRRDAANLAILKDQLAEIESDLRAGTLSAEQYEQAKTDLERRVLEEVALETTHTAQTTTSRARITAVVLVLAVPLGAVALYAGIGEPNALVQQAEQPAHDFTPQQIEQMVAQLAERMRTNPDDPRGWAILGRTYYVMQRYDEAADAYAELIKRIPPDADVLADYADALAMAQGRKLAGKPLEVVQQALQLDPDHWKSLALAGTEAFEREDYRAAVGYWERLQKVVPADSEIGQQVTASIAEARERGGMAKAPVAPQAAVAGASVGGTVQLAPELAAKADPADTVFVYARPVDGPKMPLAIVRMQVKDLPAQFTLDDTQAMTPAARLSQHQRVELVARVSKSGSATVQSGDLIAGARDVDVGSSDLSLLIDTQVP